VKENSFYNFYTYALPGGDRARLVQEIFANGKLVDVEVWPGWLKRETCDQQAVARNRMAIREGNHISLYVMMYGEIAGAA